ncbi:hypothetical protein E2C01_052549 [Portunus trituberculatus]|uniref:Uncharacterized protein n=1 Tax=Portunus trituberculatus TaxID=210409 RepID=A0A5B7GM32_PORTR|nr:hypothetical protein [Portunus trituberculatus]
MIKVFSRQPVYLSLPDGTSPSPYHLDHTSAPCRPTEGGMGPINTKATTAGRRGVVGHTQHHEKGMGRGVVGGAGPRWV